MSEAELEAYLSLTAQCMTAALKAHPVDVIHANHTIAQPSIAARVSAALGIPFIIFPHGSAIEYTVRQDPRFQKLAKEAIEAATGLIIGSKEVQGRLRSLYPDLDAKLVDRTRIIGVGVDTALFTPIERAQRSASIQALAAEKPRRRQDPRAGSGDGAAPGQRGARGRARIQGRLRSRAPDADAAERLLSVDWKNSQVALFVGALTVGKGMQSVIAALPAVLQKVERAHLIVVGSGAYREVLEGLVHLIATSNEAMLERMVAQGNDLDDTHLSGPWADVQAYLRDPERKAQLLSVGDKLKSHVHFVGRLNHALLRFLFPCADLAIFPSVIPEAYPLVLMESLSNGVLPTATNFSGFKEGLDLLIPHLGEAFVENMRLPLDPEVRVQGIATRLSALLSDGNERGGELRKIAVSEYDWAIRAQSMVEAYSALIGA